MAHNLREVCAIEGQYRSIAVYEEGEAHIVLAGIKDRTLYIHFLNKQGQLSLRQPCGLGKYRFGNQSAVTFDQSGNIVVLDGQLPAKMYIFGQDGILTATVKPCIQQFKQLNSLTLWKDKVFVTESEKVIVLHSDGTYSHEISVPGNAMSVDIRENKYIYITDSKSNIHIFPIDSDGRISPGKIGYCMMVEDYPVCMKLRGPEIWMSHGQKKYISVSTLSNEGMNTTKLLKHRGFVPLDMAWDDVGHLFVAMGVSATAKAALRVYVLEQSSQSL
jgi:hypothetical protein